MTLTAVQIRDACELLDWYPSVLARRTSLPLSVVTRATGHGGPARITADQGASIERILVAAGIEFTSDPPGVRLRSMGSM